MERGYILLKLKIMKIRKVLMLLCYKSVKHINKSFRYYCRYFPILILKMPRVETAILNCNVLAVEWSLVQMRIFWCPVSTILLVYVSSNMKINLIWQQKIVIKIRVIIYLFNNFLIELLSRHWFQFLYKLNFVRVKLQNTVEYSADGYSVWIQRYCVFPCRSRGLFRIESRTTSMFSGVRWVLWPPDGSFLVLNPSPPSF